MQLRLSNLPTVNFTGDYVDEILFGISMSFYWVVEGQSYC